MRRLGVRVLLSGVPLVLALAGDDCSAVKTGGATGVSMTGVSTTINLNAAFGAAAEGVSDTVRAGQPGNTEIEGVPLVCTERDAKGNRFCEAQK